MLSVWQADQQAAVGVNRVADAAQRQPWVAQVLPAVAEDPAVAREQPIPQRRVDVLDIAGEGFGAVLCGDCCVIRVDVETDKLGMG
jgi:hypothetical protein